jgi:predicted MFS family arabinose efflux permease
LYRRYIHNFNDLSRKTWRSPFYFLGGLSFLCFLGGLISVDSDLPSEEEDKRVDWLGGFLVTTGLVFIVFVLSQGELAQQGWGTPYKSCSI